jgi:hypothetical protein
VVVAEGVMNPDILASPALDVWIASVRGPVTLLHPHGTRAPNADDAVVLPAPPMGALALVASERLRIAPLSRWWAEKAGLPPPPFLLAATGPAALPALLGLMAGTLAETHAREAALGRALTVTRLELEETRESLADSARLLAHRPSLPPRLVLSGEAGEAAPTGRPLRQMLGVSLAGLAAIAIHLASVPPGPGALRLRLLGGESDGVAGSWLVPFASLAPGWLTLDLPTPIGALRETAVLELVPEGNGAPIPSLDARWAGAGEGHPLALRAWAGAPGSRYLAPAFWDPEELGLTLPAAGVPHALPAGSWRMARSLEGDVRMAALGDEELRPVLRAAAGARAVLLLPHLHAPGLDHVRIAFTATGGRGASVAAWVHPLGAELPDAASLGWLAGPADWAGWRDLPQEGTELVLALSGALGGRAQLAIGLRADADEALAEISGVSLVASRPCGAILEAQAAPPPIAPPPVLRDEALAPPTREQPSVAEPEPVLPMAPPVQEPGAQRPAPPPATISPDRPDPVAPSGEAAPRTEIGPEAAPELAQTPQRPASARPVRIYAPAPPPMVAPVAVMPSRHVSRPAGPVHIPARHEGVRLHQHLPGASYEHLDLTVSSLSRGPARWPNARVKLAMKDGEPRMEFRQAAGWPQVFRDWLGRASDRFGPFLRITQPELREFLASITDERDAALMQALLAVLPQAAEDAARQAGLSVTDTARWVAAAKQLQAENAPASSPADEGIS